jgi:thiol-disulfide isomerase/thioredoxin
MTMLTILRQRPWIAAAAAGIVVGAVLAVLYVMKSGPVHAPPASLSRLVFEKTPSTVAEVAFSDAQGGRHTLKEFRGRYVLLNLWATWCGPCVKELPALAKLKSSLGGAGMEVVAVNVGRSSADETARFLTDHHAEALTPYLDTNLALMRVFGAYGLPLTVLIDSQGHLVAKALGPAEWDDPAAIGYFKTLATVKSAK